MGAGKSLVSQSLAETLGRRRVSTDELLESREWHSVSEIFRTRGEAYFRQQEADVVRELAGQQDLIIDCGGGVMINPENIRLLKQKGILFYLMTSPEIVWKRVQRQSHRPLLQVEEPLEKIKELLSEREKFYKQADIVIDTDSHTVEDTAQAVLRYLNDDGT